MKRVLASILMTVVLLLSLLVPAGADHAVPFPTKVIPLWNADENWDSPGDFTVDRETQVEGEGCVSIELGKNATFIAQIKLPEVDATGMRYLEFDVYVSDLAILEAWLALEGDSIGISSSGQPDRAEKRVHFHEIAKQSFVKGCPRVGWNHVAIPLDQMSDIEGGGGKLDLSQVNFLRIFIINWSLASVPEAKDWVLKFDNFVLTNREVAFDPHTPGEWQYDEDKHWRYCTECDKKIDETFHSEHSHPPYVYDREFTCYACKQVCGPLNERGKYASFIQQIERLYQLSEDDFDLDSMKEQYNALMSEWDALAEDERQLLTVGGYEKMLKIVKKAIEVCEEKLAILNKYESLIAELSWLKDFLQESNWTWENWQRAGDIATASREMVDSMKRIEKEVLREYGYLAVLEEAEDRVFIISDPPPTEIDDPTEPQTPQTPAVPVAPTDNGCSAVLVSGAPAMLALIAAAGWMLRKKKQ